MGVSLEMYEREVSINFNDAEETARVYAASPAWMRKLDRLCESNSEDFKCTEDSRIDGQVVGRFYEFPKSLITIRSKSRTLTDEQRAARAEQLSEARMKKGGAANG